MYFLDYAKYRIDNIKQFLLFPLRSGSNAQAILLSLFPFLFLSFIFLPVPSVPVLSSHHFLPSIHFPVSFPFLSIPVLSCPFLSSPLLSYPALSFPSRSIPFLPFLFLSFPFLF